MPECIVVVDYGSQFSHLITRRLRELNVLSVLVPAATTLKDILAESPAGVILSGGPNSVNDEGAPGLTPGLLEQGLPLLGVCYGMQLLAKELGGAVGGGGVKEYGKAALADYGGQLFEGIEGEFLAWMSHGDAVTRLPAGFTATATTESGALAAMEDRSRRMFGLQFHPEVQHTPKGMAVLGRFVELTGLARDWTPAGIVESAVAQVREQVGEERVLLGISGGVDSTTLGLLLHQAIGEQLVAVFVDHGLLRLGEVGEVERALRALGVSLTLVDASERFVSALSGVTDPETKRKIIGREFIEVFSREARRQQADAGPIRFLAQGTLYPDVIESAGVPGAANIKSHHNVGGLPADLEFELVEPFRKLFKDEVREVAERLGLPAHLRDRHPFPGPGLAVRIIGEVTPERLDVLTAAPTPTWWRYAPSRAWTA